MKKNIKKMTKIDKIIAVTCFLLTLFRIFIASKLPLLIQADAMYDDALFIRYATSILSFNWLGDFSYLTLAKGNSFSFFILFNYLLGIPYSLGLILLYIGAIILFIFAIKKIIDNKYFLAIIYIILLYSPIMFHVENVQKIYRGGVIVSFALIIIAGVIGIYSRITDKKYYKSFLSYILLTTVSLSYFWFLKEDSIWILPFVFGGLFLSIIKNMKTKETKKFKIKKNIYILMPIVFLGISIISYKSINYIKYGEFAVTDRNGTYFKDVIHDLLMIEDENQNENYWITYSMMNSAYEVSPHLSIIKNKMEEKYHSYWADENGEIHGDIIYWVIKEAVNECGIYDKGGKAVNEYYKNIHDELNNAFKTGKLKKNNDIYISSVTKGINQEELQDFIDLMKKSKNVLINYSENETGIYVSTGSNNGIALFNELTTSQFILPNVDLEIYKPATYIVNTSKLIVNLYQKFASIIYYISIMCFIINTIVFFIKLFTHKITSEHLSIYLIILGLSISCFILFFGVTFFGRFLSLRKIYDYLSPIVPLLQIIKFINIYLFMKILYTKFRYYYKNNN